jgi:ABC-2 type transport system permease protein
MTRIGLRQVLGVKRLLLLGAFSLIPAIITMAITGDIDDGTAFRRFHDGPFVTLLLLVLPLVALFLGAAALGEERRDATLSFLLLRPRPREAIVGAKLLAAWLATTIVIGGSAAATGLVLAATTGRTDVVGPLVGSVIVAGLGYAAVFLILGYASSRAVVYGAFYVLFWELGLAQAVDALAAVSISRIGITVYVDLLPSGATRTVDALLANLQPGTWGAIAKVAVIGAVVVELSALLLRRRDVT